MADINTGRKYRITIRVGIVLVFVSIFLAMSLMIMSLVMWRSYENAVILTNQITNTISNSVLRELNAQLNPAQATSKLSAELIQSGALDKDRVQQTKKFVELHAKNPQSFNYCTKMLIGEMKKVIFVISRHEENGTISSEVIHPNTNPPIRFRLERDVNGNAYKQTPIAKIDYDPRNRPWYVAAKAKKSAMWSKAYVFYSGKKGTLGVTSVTPVYDKGKLQGMFGIDVKLSSIANFLRQIRISDHGFSTDCQSLRRHSCL